MSWKRAVAAAVIVMLGLWLTIPTGREVSAAQERILNRPDFGGGSGL